MKIEVDIKVISLAAMYLDSFIQIERGRLINQGIKEFESLKGPMRVLQVFVDLLRSKGKL